MAAVAAATQDPIAVAVLAAERDWSQVVEGQVVRHVRRSAIAGTDGTVLGDPVVDDTLPVFPAVSRTAHQVLVSIAKSYQFGRD
jgi:hypothetical protein